LQKIKYTKTAFEKKLFFDFFAMLTKLSTLLLTLKRFINDITVTNGFAKSSRKFLVLTLQKKRLIVFQ